MVFSGRRTPLDLRIQQGRTCQVRNKEGEGGKRDPGPEPQVNHGRENKGQESRGDGSGERKDGPHVGHVGSNKGRNDEDGDGVGGHPQVLSALLDALLVVLLGKQEVVYGDPHRNVGQRVVDDDGEHEAGDQNQPDVVLGKVVEHVGLHVVAEPQVPKQAHQEVLQDHSR